MKIGIFKFLIIIALISSLISFNLDLLLQKSLTELLGYQYNESFFLLFFIITFLPMTFFSFGKEKEKIFPYNTIPESIENISYTLNSAYSNELNNFSTVLKTNSSLSKLLLALSIILFIFEIIFLIITKKFRHISWIFLMTCFFIILRLGIKKDNTEISYRKFYKEKIIPSFIKEIFPNLNFLNNIDDTNKKIIKQEYLSSNFDKISIQRFEINDFLVGYMNDNSYIKISNLRLENKATKQAYLTIFSGLFVYTTLSTSIDTSIKICLNQNFSIDNKQYFEMDNSFFENYFDIYTDNKMISLKILTHDVMEQLVNFYEKYNIPFEIILNNKKLYLRFFTKDFFVPRKIDGTINKNELFEYYCILNFITDVTTKINTIVNEKKL